MRKFTFVVTALLATAIHLTVAKSALASTIILEGSDAIGNHCPQPSGSPSGCEYESQVWSALDGGSGKTIGVIGTNVNDSATGSQPGSNTFNIPLDVVASLDELSSPLSSYAALYFLPDSGCCTEDDSLVAGNQAAILAYLAGGGTIMIGDYTGGSSWDFAVGTTNGDGNDHVTGIGGGDPGFTDGCSDGETVTASGLANGFTQPLQMDCWTHQAYDESFFATLGFSNSFMNAPLGWGDGGGAGPYSGLLSTGSTLTEIAAAPEPASFVLIGTGIVGLGFLRRRVTG